MPKTSRGDSGARADDEPRVVARSDRRAPLEPTHTATIATSLTAHGPPSGSLLLPATYRGLALSRVSIGSRAAPAPPFARRDAAQFFSGGNSSRATSRWASRSRAATSSARSTRTSSSRRTKSCARRTFTAPSSRCASQHPAAVVVGPSRPPARAALKGDERRRPGRSAGARSSRAARALALVLPVFLAPYPPARPSGDARRSVSLARSAPL